MLAAADILSTVSPTTRQLYRRHLLFTAFAGETWDYMGSKRFLWELHSGGDSTAGLSLDLIDQVNYTVRTVKYPKSSRVEVA